MRDRRDAVRVRRRSSRPAHHSYTPHSHAPSVPGTACRAAVHALSPAGCVPWSPDACTPVPGGCCRQGPDAVDQSPVHLASRAADVPGVAASPSRMPGWAGMPAVPSTGCSRTWHFEGNAGVVPPVAVPAVWLVCRHRPSSGRCGRCRIACRQSAGRH